MTIYVDEPAWRWRGRLWSHLISDSSIEELHEFARIAGLRYLSFGIDHYDVPDVMLDHVVSVGAQMADSRDLVRYLRAADLRKRRGKDARTWRPTSFDDAGFIRDERKLVDALVAEQDVAANDLWVAERPGTIVVAMELDELQPSELDLGAHPRVRRVETQLRDGWSLELVIGDF